MSLSTLLAKVALSPDIDMMQRDLDWCAQFSQQYVVYVERWGYNPYGLPVLEREVLFASPDLDQAQNSFRLTMTEGKFGAGRVNLSYVGACDEEARDDPQAEWDIGGEGGGD
jgi:hypothetical protein